MARTNRIKSDGDAHYHVMSRTNGKRMLFERGEVKAELVDALRRAAAFSGVELKAYAAMGNHFHAVVKVVKPDAPVDAEELLRRVGALKGERERRAYAERWKRLALAGDTAALAAEQERLRVRMHDVSGFVKTFKDSMGTDPRRPCILSWGQALGFLGRRGVRRYGMPSDMRSVQMPSGVKDFKRIRQEDFCYVDKTAFFRRMEGRADFLTRCDQHRIAQKSLNFLRKQESPGRVVMV